MSSNLVIFKFISDICVGSMNAYKYGRPRVQSGQLNGIANLNFSKQKVPRFECGMTYDLNCTKTCLSTFTR